MGSMGMLGVGSDDSVQYRDIVNSLPVAAVVTDANLTVKFANVVFYRMFNVGEADTIDKGFFSICDGIWDDTRLHGLLAAVVPHNVTVDSFECEQTFPIVGKRILRLAARNVLRDARSTGQVLITVKDVTDEIVEQRQAVESLDRANAMFVEIHHRVKNNIASILSMLRLEARGIEDDASRDVLDRISGRIDSMSSLYELLATTEISGMVQLREYFRKLCASIEEMSSAPGVGWAINVTGDNPSVGVDETLTIGAVVHELVANAAKYAFHGRQDIGQIAVDCLETGGEIKITVSDNGSGIRDGDTAPKSTGLGMRLVDMYLRSLDAVMTRETSDKGTICTIRIPRRSAAQSTAAPGTANAIPAAQQNPAKAE
ncbi:MAG: histidine kinase dimerization/phosphoacceptor domain -containing protein [Devosia sp.]